MQLSSRPNFPLERVRFSYDKERDITETVDRKRSKQRDTAAMTERRDAESE